MSGKGAIAQAFAVDPAGRTVRQTQEQAEATSGAHGYTPVSEQDYQRDRKAVADQAYVDQNWGDSGKAAAGLASGLSLGLAPALATKIGLLDRGHLEAAEQSGLYTAGDVAGMVAPALLSGGESLIGRGLAEGGAKGAGRLAMGLSPAGLMGEGGTIAEALAGRFLPEAGLLGKAASSTLKIASRGAAEGAVINLSHNVSDAVITNKPLAAQSLLASGLEGALFGGLTGGILGGATAAAGAGVDAIGSRAAGMAGGSGEVAAGKFLKFAGASDSKIAELAQREGGLQGAVRGYSGVIEGSDVGQGVSHIHGVAKASAEGYRATAQDAIQTMDREFPLANGRIRALGQRITDDINVAYAGTLEHEAASKLTGNLVRELEGVASDLKAPSPPREPNSKLVSKSGNYKEAVRQYEKDLAAYEAAPKDPVGGLNSWSDLAKSREQLADRVIRSTGLKQDVYKTALNAYDGELRMAMESADADLATKYAAAVTGQRQAMELSDLTAVGASAPKQSAIHLDPSDLKTFGFMGMTGANPIVAGGIIAAKKIGGYLQQKLEAPIAESAYRAAIGAEAGKATVSIGSRVSTTLKNFMGGATKVATSEGLKSFTKPSYTMGGYEKAMKLADDLTSQSHQTKVREMTEALSRMGHPDLAQEMALTYGRAAAYVAQNKPKGGSKEHQAGSLGKLPKSIGLTTQGMKFMRGLHALNAPMDSILGGIERGDLSRDAVAAVKYVFPDLHQDIVYRASQEMVAIRSEGKYIPADKLAMLGTVLDAPVDSKLMPEFIAEIQKSHAANKAPTPDQGKAPPPVTDVSAYQTPAQKAVS